MTSVIMQPGPNYHGVHHFYENNRIKEYQPLSGQQYDKQTLVDLKDTILSNMNHHVFMLSAHPLVLLNSKSSSISLVQMKEEKTSKAFSTKILFSIIPMIW